jgi:hypothetical protein
MEKCSPHQAGLSFKYDYAEEGLHQGLLHPVRRELLGHRAFGVLDDLLAGLDHDVFSIRHIRGDQHAVHHQLVTHLPLEVFDLACVL